jgi:phosphoribosylaminoimidazolecarboxamide formyltransferase / IMP cyclohydrolase
MRHPGEAYLKANLADRVAAFGGCIALNRPVDRATAEAITGQYAEVVVAPGFEEGAMEIFGRKPDLRVIRIDNMAACSSSWASPAWNSKA